MSTKPLTRTYAHRIRRMSVRLGALLDELDRLPATARRLPAPKPLAGNARRTLTEAATLFGLPAVPLESPLTPAVILTVTSTIVEGSKALVHQALATLAEAENRHSFPRRFEDA